MNANTYDDIFSKFEDIDMSAEQKTSTEDVAFCAGQEEIFKQLVSIHNNLILQLQDVQNLTVEYGGKYNTAYCYSLNPEDIKETITKMKNKFISTVCEYFMKKYNITINYDEFKNKYNEEIKYEQVINEITEQLGGYNFQEKAEQEIKQKLSESFKWRKAECKGKKLLLSGFLYIDTSWKQWGTEKLHYNSTDQFRQLLKAIQHFENGSINMGESVQSLFEKVAHGKNEEVFNSHELGFTKIKSIKIFKNGKVEIEFDSNKNADLFKKTYCTSNAA